MSSSGEDEDTESLPPEPASSSTAVRTIIESLSGVHGFKLSQTALRIADKEANAGLTAKAKGVASAIIKKTKTRNQKCGGAVSAQGRKSGSSTQNRAKDFQIRAIVLYTNGLVTDEYTGKLRFDSIVHPVVAEGPLRDREEEGCATFDVTLNRDWNSARVDRALRSVFPGFFSHCETEFGYDLDKGEANADLRPYVFCYRDVATRPAKLCVYAKRGPTGEDLYGLKSRKGRGSSDSFIHIASIESIDPSVTSTWTERAEAPDDNRTPETGSQSPSPRPARSSAAKKGKKRSRSIAAIQSDDSEVELLEGPSKGTGSSASTLSKKSRLLRQLDKAALAPAPPQEASTSALSSKPKPLGKSTKPITYSLADFSPSPSPISDTEFPFPELSLDSGSGSNTGSRRLASASVSTNMAADADVFETPTRPTPSSSHITAAAGSTVSPSRYELPTGMENPWY